MPQPHRGERRAHTVRIPMALFHDLDKAAEAAGYIKQAGSRSPGDDFGGFLAATLEKARDAGLYADPKPGAKDSQLPLSA